MTAKRAPVWKVVVALCGVLGAMGGGYGGYEALSARQDAIDKAIVELGERQVGDIRLMNERVMALRMLMDNVSSSTAANGSKLDVVLQLLRDHMAKDTK